MAAMCRTPARSAPTTSTHRRRTRSACACRRARATRRRVATRRRARRCADPDRTREDPSRARAPRRGRCSRSRSRPGHRRAVRVRRGRRRRRRSSSMHLGQPADLELPAARAGGERFDARLVASPPDGVAGRAQEPGAFNRVADADRVEQLRAARRQRHGEAVPGGRPGDQPHGVAPLREQQRRRGAGGTAADDQRPPEWQPPRTSAGASP